MSSCSTKSKTNSKCAQLVQFASTARALVISRKAPCTIQELDRDFKEVEGEKLPYQKYGFNSAEDLLRATGEFIFKRIGAQIVISAKPNDKTGHIVSLVQGQKSSQKKSVRYSSQMRYPQSRSSVQVTWNRIVETQNRARYTTNNDRNNNQHYYNRFQPKPPSHQYQPILRNIMNTPKQKPLAQRPILGQNNITNSNVAVNPRSQMQQQQQTAPKSQPINHNTELAYKKPQENVTHKHLQNQNVEQIQQNKQNHKQELITLKQRQDTFQQCHQQRSQLDQNQIQCEEKQKPQHPPQQKGLPKQELPQKPQQHSNSIRRSTCMTSVQNRLKINFDGNKSLSGAHTQPKPLPALSADDTNRLQKVVANGQFNMPPQPAKSPNFPEALSFLVYNNGKLDEKASLLQYCLNSNFPPPEYSILMSKFSKMFQCRVVVNGIVYSTYPTEYPNAELAKNACAERAVEQIKEMVTRLPLPTCTDSDHKLKQKLYNALLEHPSGLFAKKIPHWFEDKFQQSLPEYWWTLVQASNLFSTEVAATDETVIIVLANLNIEKEELNASVTVQLSRITLPWTKKHWNLFITYCPSTVEIWGRLLGEEHNRKLDELLVEVNEYMLTKKEQPSLPTCGQIYLEDTSDRWNRVRVEEINEEIALCFFIDFGDIEWIPINNLYICEARFLHMPAQAIPLSLFGLEDFAEHPNAKRHLDALLLNKPVIGEILTKESEFYNQTNSISKIQVALFDTSTQDDVSLNPLLVNKICNDTSVPTIKTGVLTNIFVTHICDDGDLYVQFVSPELKYLKKLVQSVSQFEKEQHELSNNDIKLTNLYLICVNVGEQTLWYRGALTKLDANANDDEYEIFFVDDGTTRRTNKRNMFLLDSLSTALTKFPYQAIKVRLHNIPEPTKSIVGRMRALLPTCCEALVKLATNDDVPLVTIYRRIEGTNTPCTINDVLRIEHELDTSSETVGEDYLSESIKNDNLIHLTRQLQTCTLSTTQNQSVDSKTLKSYDNIPSIGNYFEVRVTMSSNPSHFMIQPYLEYPRLRNLMKELQEHCDKNDELIADDIIEIGQAYAAKNADGFYHRVTIINKYKGEMVNVCFCDFGDVSILSCDQLKTLPAKFRLLPKMALQAKLHGIVARSIEWTHEDCLRFRELTVGKKFIATINNILYEASTSILEVSLIDVSTEEDIFIADVLLREQRAAMNLISLRD